MYTTNKFFWTTFILSPCIQRANVIVQMLDIHHDICGPSLDLIRTSTLHISIHTNKEHCPITYCNWSFLLLTGPIMDLGKDLRRLVDTYSLCMRWKEEYHRLYNRQWNFGSEFVEWVCRTDVYMVFNVWYLNRNDKQSMKGHRICTINSNGQLVHTDARFPPRYLWSEPRFDKNKHFTQQ